MEKIIEIIESVKRKRFTKGISLEIISTAEKELSLSISTEYKELLKKYGFLSMKGEEFLGIDNGNYDLVRATVEARNNDKLFPSGAYVISNLAIDGALLIQIVSGEIYIYQPNTKLQKVASSLEEYLLEL